MCGVIGVIETASESNRFQSALDVYNGLLNLQHRGQDAAGILSFDGSHFHMKKNLGLVPDIFDQRDIEHLQGSMAIGHTRYTTTGTNDMLDLQPMVTRQPFGLGMAHNGNLVNYYEMARYCEQELDIQLQSSNDLEIFMSLWCQVLQQKGIQLHQNISFSDAIEVTKHIFEKVDGGYAVVGIIAHVGLFAFRDPKGIRPLVLGKKTTQDGVRYCVVSETAALDFLHYEFVRDVEPGELIFITPQGTLFCEIVQKEQQKAHCMFEWIYFSRVESTIDQKLVYRTRLQLGRFLGRQIQTAIKNGLISPDIVCPVPDTARPATISLSEEIGIPYREVFTKNQYVQRSFILNTQEAREKAVQLKMSPIVSEIQGKDILLVDDSIVRGTTSKNIVSLLLHYGAKKISLAITCPPIRHGCFYGIDFPDPRELIASNRNLSEIADWIGVDHIFYLSEEHLYQALDTQKLCMGCIKGVYPTKHRGSKEFTRKRRGAQ